MPVKFRKRPVEVEAVEWTGDNTVEMWEFAGVEFDRQRQPGDDPAITAKVFDELHSTWVGVKTGQWVVRGIRGEFYPIDPGVLAETYERVEE